MTMVWAVVILTTANDVETGYREFQEARRAYEHGRLEEAERQFLMLTLRPGELGAVARFAHANTLVRRAVGENLAPATRNSLLKNAVRQYRSLISSGGYSPLQVEDLKHNLLLAKNLIEWREPNADNATNTSREQPQQSPGDAKLTPRDPSKKDNLGTPKRGAPTQENKGAVKDPLPGVNFNDPGVLTPDEADARLRRAIDRIRSNPSKPFPKSRPNVPDDY